MTAFSKSRRHLIVCRSANYHLAILLHQPHSDDGVQCVNGGRELFGRRPGPFEEKIRSYLPDRKKAQRTIRIAADSSLRFLA